VFKKIRLKRPSGREQVGALASSQTSKGAYPEKQQQ
jgi:hypothetical protein